MWLVKTLLPALLMIAIMGFAFLNPDQIVDVDLYFRQYEGVQLTAVVFVSILLGMALMLSISIFHDFRVRSLVRQLKVENRRLSEELTALRTSPLEGLEAREER